MAEKQSNCPSQPETPPLHICYQWRIRFLVQKKNKKTKKTYPQSFTEIAGKESDLALHVAEICKKRKYELLQIISWQALKVCFAFYKDHPECPFVSEEVKDALPLPYQGKEVMMTEENPFRSFLPLRPH